MLLCKAVWDFFKPTVCYLFIAKICIYYNVASTHAGNRLSDQDHLLLHQTLKKESKKKEDEQKEEHIFLTLRSF